MSPSAPSCDRRLRILRAAFKATIEDKAYKADAEKSKLPVDYISGEEVEQYVEKIYSVSPDVRKRLDFLVRTRKTS